MGGIHEDLGRIDQSVFIAFLQDTGKDLFKKISILKASGIILSKRREMGNLVHHFQTEEPSVCDIDFDFFYCLAHTSDAVQILDEWNFNEHDRIHAGAAIVCTVFIDHKIIDKTPVDCLVNQAQQMILRNKVIHAEHLNLFSFLICILCHHRKHRLYFDTFIIPKK